MYVVSSTLTYRWLIILPSAWKNAESVLVAQIEATRENRRIQARQRRFCERRRIVNTFYDAYKAQRTAFECRLLPNTMALCTLPELKERVEADPDVEDSFSDIEERLPALILAHEERMRREARNTLANARGTNESAESGEPIDLDLATSVLHCGRCNVLIFGWSEHQQHKCTNNSIGVYYHHVNVPAHDEGYHRPSLLSTSVMELIRLAGLDPATATVEDMDTANVHFLCPAHQSNHFGSGALSYFSWRSYVRLFYH